MQDITHKSLMQLSMRISISSHPNSLDDIFTLANQLIENIFTTFLKFVKFQKKILLNCIN